jgi:hypothetical protein
MTSLQIAIKVQRAKTVQMKVQRVQCHKGNIKDNGSERRSFSQLLVGKIEEKVFFKKVEVEIRIKGK